MNLLPEEDRGRNSSNYASMRCFQHCGINGNDGWKNTLHIDEPEGLEGKSPFGFKTKLYDEALELARTLHSLSNKKEMEETAYNIAVMFKNTKQLEQYLDHVTNRWGHYENLEALHKALSFDLPDKGVWNINVWRDRLLTTGPSLIKHLKYAPEIESVLEDDTDISF